MEVIAFIKWAVNSGLIKIYHSGTTPEELYEKFKNRKK
jgi:hypothetical protein